MSKQYTALIDVDTLIVHAGIAGQETYVTVTHKETGWTREFKNQTEFFGDHHKKAGGWLAEINKSKEEKGLPAVSPEAFTIEAGVRLIEDVVHENGTAVTPEQIVKGRFKSKVEAIVNQPWCKDFKICYGTGTNFRYDIAETVPYKNERPSKPLLFDVVRDYMLWKYKDHMLIADGVETDEIVTQELWNGWLKSKQNFNKLDVVGCWIDKDLAQFPQLHYNFDKPELGIVQITPLEAIKSLAVQCLMGDKVDTIPGLPALPDDLYKHYSLRKTKGLGETTAKGVISSAETHKEVFERVVEAYKGFYGEAKQPFTSFRGVASERNWIDHLNEQFRLLRMRTDVTKDVGHVADFLNSMGIELGGVD
jgi:hypothetical protein